MHAVVVVKEQGITARQNSCARVETACNGTGKWRGDVAVASYPKDDVREMASLPARIGVYVCTVCSAVLCRRHADGPASAWTFERSQLPAWPLMVTGVWRIPPSSACSMMKHTRRILCQGEFEFHVRSRRPSPPPSPLPPPPCTPGTHMRTRHPASQPRRLVTHNAQHAACPVVCCAPV